jgi:hypothetical protein
VDDLLKWDTALYTEKLVPKSAVEKIFTPFRDNYAYGWLVATASGRKMAGHAGGINGFVTNINRFPNEKVCVVVLSNLEGAPVTAMSRDLAAIAFGEKYSIPGTRKEIKVASKVFDTYAGQYDLDQPKVTITITRADDQLMAQVTGQSRFRVFPESETSYFYKVVDAQIDFVKEGGKVTHLILHQGGLDLKGKRREPEKTAEPKTKKP